MAIAGFGEIAEQLRRSTVLIHAGGRGSGSGVIWSGDGTIVTNAHVGAVRTRACSSGTDVSSTQRLTRVIHGTTWRRFESALTLCQP